MGHLTNFRSAYIFFENKLRFQNNKTLLVEISVNLSFILSYYKTWWTSLVCSLLKTLMLMLVDGNWIFIHIESILNFVHICVCNLITTNVWIFIDFPIIDDTSMAQPKWRPEIVIKLITWNGGFCWDHLVSSSGTVCTPLLSTNS